MSPQRPAPDQEHRDGAIRARGVNVLVDAGAGTGKTTLLVGRLVEMVAPSDDSSKATPLERIAAVTFTRKAAGELKLRVREKLLSELARTPSPLRRDRLSLALAAADTAFIGTIHGFSDRLLRRRPVEARLSPSYEILEDPSELTHEAFEILLQASEAGRLADELAGTSCPPERAAEAQEHIRAALAAELRTETREGLWHDRHGLDALFEGFILHRDVPPRDAKPPPFQAARAGQAIQEFLALAGQSRGVNPGSRWMGRVADRLSRLAGETDPVVLFREVGAALAYRPGKLRKSVEFEGDPAGWEALKAWDGKKDEPGLEALVTGPLRRWMATRLVRTFPAVVAMYEKVKARHRAVDQVDLLLRLRDLLQSDREVRRDMQSLFDHVFVDEFQDTDPLQAEIVLYLCEDGAVAEHWGDVRLAAGKLTLVGDPKQSIYRFRRADISVYDAVRAIVVKGKHLAVPLTANFRSQPALIAHVNARFDEILGRAEPGKPDFDPEAGTVVNRPLDAGREGVRKGCVVVLPFSTEANRAEPDRLREAEVLATWIRTAVAGEFRHGDIAILAHVTSNVGMLTDELDRLGVPWTARGASLFLEDPLHRQFLLALRALADSSDGIAAAALFREPFFALDLDDLVRAKAAGSGPGDEGIDRARAAQALVQDLRRRRFDRPPGETARDLLERTGLGRAVAFGPNGLQRLGRLRELCFELERVAAGDGLDFDGATARLRAWALDPVGLDPPRPVGGEAVQILSIHQAKGLEFPVVAWWDAHAKLEPRKGTDPLVRRADGDGVGARDRRPLLAGTRGERIPGPGIGLRGRRAQAARLRGGHPGQGAAGRARRRRRAGHAGDHGARRAIVAGARCSRGVDRRQGSHLGEGREGAAGAEAEGCRGAGEAGGEGLDRGDGRGRNAALPSQGACPRRPTSGSTGSRRARGRPGSAGSRARAASAASSGTRSTGPSASPCGSPGSIPRAPWRRPPGRPGSGITSPRRRPTWRGRSRRSRPPGCDACRATTSGSSIRWRWDGTECSCRATSTSWARGTGWSPSSTSRPTPRLPATSRRRTHRTWSR